MPVICFASSKGGAGKTTSAVLLAGSLSRKDEVILIDADPAKRLLAWANKADLPEKLLVHTSAGEAHIHDEIDAANKKAKYVIIDMEGAATRLNAYIMGESDLVIIPMGDEQPDAEGAIETLAELAREARSMRREIPVRILFARTKPAIKSRLEKSLNAQVRDKIGSFTVELHRRMAFSALHNYGGTVYDLNKSEVSGVDKSIQNSEAFAVEVMNLLQTLN